MVSLGAYHCHVEALITLTANWFDTLAVKQREIIINNDVLLSSVTNEETPYYIIGVPTLLIISRNMPGTVTSFKLNVKRISLQRID